MLFLHVAPSLKHHLATQLEAEASQCSQLPKSLSRRLVCELKMVKMMKQPKTAMTAGTQCCVSEQHHAECSLYFAFSNIMPSADCMLRLLAAVRESKEHWKSGPKNIVTMSDSSKFEHLLQPKLQELAATCGQPSGTPFQGKF